LLSGKSITDNKKMAENKKKGGEKMKKTKKGFTLIELLVVIAIIGILSAIGLVSLNGAREKARDAQRKSDLSQYRTALALYYDDNNHYVAPTAADTGENVTANVDGALVTDYMSAALTDPVNSGDNVYMYMANDTSAPDKYLLYDRLEGSGQVWYYITYGGTTGTLTTTPTSSNYD